MCFTGTLKRKRAEATKLAQKAGADVKGSVTKAVTVLVAGADAGSKADKAGPNVKVLSEKEFDALLDDGDDSSSESESDDSSEEAPKKSVKKAAKPAAKKAGATKRKHDDDDEEEEEDEAKAPAAKKTKVSGSREVDRVFGHSGYSVHGDWAVMLNQTNIDGNANNNKFYKMQLLKGKNDFVLWTRWGRVGVEGQTGPKTHPDAAAGEKAFCQQFRSKTQNDYLKTVVNKSEPFNKVKGKYQLVDLVDDDGDDDAPVGKLSEEQIKKGQTVLEKLRNTLESGKAKGDKLALLSSDYYSQIPTDCGFKKPPVLDTLDMVEAQEEKLKFMMRMGFDEMVLEEEEDDAETPIHGLLDLSCPKTLAETKPKGASKSDLSGSVKKADGLYKKAKAKLDASVVRAATIDPKELYGSVLLYTSNCIYRELNQSLRDMDRKAVKQGYFSYLRLLFESFTFLKSCGKENPSTLWRGVGVDLSKEYKVGSTITWWGVSSCTSAKEVAESFAGGCKDSTLLTIETTSGVDISSITYYPHEKETLLAPGTKLKVLTNKKGKSFVEIRLKEVSE